MTSEFPIPEALRTLGSPLQVCPPRAGAGRAGYLTIAGVLAVLAGLTVIGIVNPPEHNPPPPAVFVSLFAVLGAGSLVFLCVAFYIQSYTLILFPDGVARTGGGAPEIFRWSDIKEIYAFINPVSGKHRLVAQDGRKLEIDASVKDGKKLGQKVEQTLLDRMLPAATKAFEAGDTLTFGLLRADYNYLYYKDKQLSWHDIGKMQLLYNAYTHAVQFEVRKAGAALLPWCVVKTQDIPNLNVFKALVERRRPFNQ